MILNKLSKPTKVFIVSELTYYDQFLLIKIDQFSKDNLLYAENTSF